MERIQSLIPDQAESIEQVFQEHKNELKNTSDSTGFAQTIAEFLALKLAANFELEELENKILIFNKENRNYFPLNRLLMYEIKDESIYLHIATLFDVKPTELPKLIVDGLKELAQEIRTESNLQSLKKVKGESWIVYDHPTLIEKLGFSITGTNQELREGSAEISVEKLLQTY